MLAVSFVRWGRDCIPLKKSVTYVLFIPCGRRVLALRAAARNIVHHSSDGPLTKHPIVTRLYVSPERPFRKQQEKDISKRSEAG